MCIRDRVKCEVEASQVLLENESFSKDYLGDEWSQKGPLSFCVSGKARWCLSNVVLPSAGSESVKWVWESDDRESDRDCLLYTSRCV